MKNKQYSSYSRKKGFTLAEVLVTLAVIGVVAALTIPALINNSTDKQLHVMWKKQFSVVSQAVKRIEAENGSINFSSDSTMSNDFETVMTFVKKGAYNTLADGIYSYYENNSDTTDLTHRTFDTAIMQDGSMWEFAIEDTDCTGSVGSLTGICASIRIDVNGNKTPNMIGKDYHRLWIVRTNGTYVVYPWGSHDDGRDCVANDSNILNSEGCATLALIRSVDDMP